MAIEFFRPDTDLDEYDCGQPGPTDDEIVKAIADFGITAVAVIDNRHNNPETYAKDLQEAMAALGAIARVRGIKLGNGNRIQEDFNGQGLA